MIASVLPMGEFVREPLNSEGEGPWMRRLFSTGPDRPLHVIAGPTIAVLELHDKERMGGISSWDVRRLFYFRIQVDLACEDGSFEKAWVLVARNEVEKTVPDFEASFFRGGFNANYVAQQFLNHFRIDPETQGKERVRSFFEAIGAIPHHRITELSRVRFPVSFFERELYYVAGHWNDWKKGYGKSEWFGTKGANSCWSRFTRKKEGTDTLPRTITVVRRVACFSYSGSYQVEHVYVHFNKEGEGLLGSGAFNTAKLVYDIITGTWGVIRQVGDKNIDDANLVALREYMITSQLDDPSIDKPVVIGKHVKKDGKERVWTIHELGRCTLSDHHTGTELERLLLAQGVVDGVRYLHGEGVVHRDLKPSNVLISESGKPKIADFGCANKPGIPDIDGGTLLYRYPFNTQCKKPDPYPAIPEGVRGRPSPGFFSRIDAVMDLTRRPDGFLALPRLEDCLPVDERTEAEIAKDEVTIQRAIKAWEADRERWAVHEKSEDLWALGMMLWESLEVNLRSTTQYSQVTWENFKDRIQRDAPMFPFFALMLNIAHQGDFLLTLIGRCFESLRLEEPPEGTKEHVVWSLLQADERRMPSLDAVSSDLDALIARESSASSA